MAVDRHTTFPQTLRPLPATSVALVRAVAAFAALTAFAAALPCQVHRTAHPQESVQDGNGDLSPFGCLGPTDFTEARTQILIRNQQLPGPGAILVGIEVLCSDTLALDYLSLEIDACPIEATRLSPTFADNISSSVLPLLRATDLRIAYDSTDWSAIPLQNPFVYDGGSDLVIEIRKVVDPATARFAAMTTTSNPVRFDLPPMVIAFGGPGSGASTAATAQTQSPALSLRLLWVGVPTVRLRSDRSAGGNQFGLGGAIVHTVEGAPGSLTVDGIGTSFLQPSLTLAPVFGRWLVEGPILGVALLPASGQAQRRILIPNNGNLVGLHLTYQSVTIDPVTGLAEFTNGVDHFISP